MFYFNTNLTGRLPNKKKYKLRLALQIKSVGQKKHTDMHTQTDRLIQDFINLDFNKNTFTKITSERPGVALSGF